MRYLAAILFFIFLTSCSIADHFDIEKRRYRSGFFIQLVHNPSVAHQYRSPNDDSLQIESVVNNSHFVLADTALKSIETQPASAHVKEATSHDFLPSLGKKLVTPSARTCTNTSAPSTEPEQHNNPKLRYIMFFLLCLLICTIIPGLLLLPYSVFVDFKYNRFLANFVRALAVLLFIAELVSVILLILSSPYWLPVYAITFSIGLLFLIIAFIQTV